MNTMHLARAIAEHLGVRGRQGGWIYSAAGRVICHGWDEWHRICLRRRYIVTRSLPLTPFIDWRKVGK